MNVNLGTEIDVFAEYVQDLLIDACTYPYSSGIFLLAELL
jgi:hypothetical protein